MLPYQLRRGLGPVARCYSSSLPRRKWRRFAVVSGLVLGSRAIVLLSPRLAGNDQVGLFCYSLLTDLKTEILRLFSDLIPYIILTGQNVKSGLYQSNCSEFLRPIGNRDGLTMRTPIGEIICAVKFESLLSN